MKAWICDHNGRWGRSEDTVWETGTLRMLVRKWNAERERDDITHTQMSKKEKASCSYQCDTTNEVASCSCCSHIWCGHLCCSRLLRASGHKTCWNPHRPADALRGTGVEISHSIQRGPVCRYLGNRLWSVEFLCSALPIWNFSLWEESKMMRQKWEESEFPSLACCGVKTCLQSCTFKSFQLIHRW